MVWELSIIKKCVKVSALSNELYYLETVYLKTIGLLLVSEL